MSEQLGMKHFWIALLSLAITTPSFSDGKLFLGLPDTLPADFLETRLKKAPPLVAFEPSAKHGLPPLGSTVIIDPKRPKKQIEIASYHSSVPNRFIQERHFVAIPEKASGYEFEDKGRKFWELPAGTEFYHEIRWNLKTGNPLFELRMIKKLQNEKWAFGLYYPVTVQGRKFLKLKKTEDPTAVDISGVFKKSPERLDEVPDLGVYEKELKLTRGWEKGYHRIRMESRISPHECQMCHSMRVYRDLESSHDEQHWVGPCSFGPDNEHVNNAEWLARFKEKTGQALIQPQ